MLEFDVDLTPRADGIATLHFVSAHRLNLLTGSLIDRLLEVVDALAADPPRVVVIEGGAQAFSGGAHIGELSQLSDDAVVDLVGREVALFRAVEALPCITIAALRGPCVGSGLELALACDFRVAADDVRCGVPEVALGFPAPVQRLTRFLTVGTAKELIFSGRLVDAHEAKQLGLFQDVVDRSVLVEAVDALAHRHRQLAPNAVRATKRLLDRAATLDVELEQLILQETARALAEAGEKRA